MSPVDEALIRFFQNSEQPILFTGAGVSAHAGVLTWGPLLDRLKEWLRSRDHLSAHQMAEYINAQDYLTAADYFFLSKKVADGDRLRALIDHLSRCDATKLISLMRLPFQGAVTTNFDRTLLDAYASAHGKAPLDFRRGDESFKQVQWCNDYFVARIHGGVELPPSIVLTTKHFESLEQDDIYKDLLSYIFTRKNVLFIGCSFLDPAIRSVFDQINKSYGPTPPGLHMALIPEDVDNDFINRLNRLNVECIRYDPVDNHRKVWDAIDVYVASSKEVPTPETKVPPPFETAKRYFASCYARVQLNGRIHSLREAVVEGIVSAIIQKHAPKAVLVKNVIDTVHSELGIHSKEAEELVTEALKRLTDEKLCRRHTDDGPKKVAWVGQAADANEFNKALDFLVKSAVDRSVVQEGLRPGRDVQQALTSFFCDLILQRGWDLGAAFASNKVPNDVDFGKLLYQSCVFLSHPEIEALKRVCMRMLANPTQEEATILAEMGRASFALELAIQCPRNVLFHSAVLPQRIYLDANVLMPALIVGHPYHEVYKQTIDRLRKAVTQSAGAVQVIAYYGFLNEVVSHRRLAIQDAEEWGDDFTEGIVKEALFYGTANMNVFVGAFANLAQITPELKFNEFLAKYAPFSSERELVQWVRKHEIVVVSDAQMKTGEYAGISHELQKAYANGLAAGKDMRLIEHDAIQLSSLFTDNQAGRRSILVTADKRLREMISKGKYKQLAEQMISNIGLAQMIDLLVGNPGVHRGLTSMIWTARASEKTEEIRQYLVNLALREYDEALAMEMPMVVERIAEDAAMEVSRSAFSIDSDNPADRRKFLRFLGDFEDKFFEAIRERIQAREKQDSADAPAINPR